MDTPNNTSPHPARPHPQPPSRHDIYRSSQHFRSASSQAQSSRATSAEKSKPASTPPTPRPLVIPSPVALSNGFSQIVKQVGPAVVNINTEELPKPSANKRSRGGLQRAPQPNTPDGDDDSPQAPGDMQDFFNRFFGGQGGGDDSDMAAENAAPSAPASSSIPAATSSPTITSSIRPTRSTSSSPAIPMTPAIQAVQPP